MVHYLCAASLTHAHHIATVDWGWRRIGDYRWTNKFGEEVRYLWRLRDLNGVGRNSVIYLGYGWYNNPDFNPVSQFEAYVHELNITLIDGTGFERRER